ncbi:hypothetical protein [Tellurirhabdus rosea]|uniref:hypothetical protein n=1 Tax=Tellurirhabdus rosea TaxID=2674997 RepID=UPI00225AC6FC|nr:hypothetical protein [Tellurirhabdus rosea]
MNQTFHFHRFGLMVRRHWAEHRLVYSYGMLVMAGFMLLWHALVRPGDDRQPVLLVVSLMLFGGFQASVTFGMFAETGRGIAFLMVPASRFEKWLVSFLFSLLVLPVMLLLYYPITAVMLDYFREADPNGQYPKEVFFWPDSGFKVIVSMYFGVHAYALLASLLFPRQAFIKGTALLFALFVVTFLVNTKIADWIISDPAIGTVGNAFPLLNAILVMPNQKNSFLTLELASSLRIWLHLFLAFFILALYGISYIRFTEKEL